MVKHECYNSAAFPILTTMSLLDKDNQPLADKEALARHIERALSVTAPSGRDVDINYRIIKSYFNPLVIGAENIPDEPCLFVGNHSLFALDGIVAAPIFLKELNRFPRALGDRFLFGNRRVADQLLKSGAVLGHPNVCTALMEDGQDLLVFPGGASEAVKPVSELYELHWKERLGFVKLAALHGYTVMPFGMVGPDEFYGHLTEGRDLLESPLGRILTRLGILNEGTRTDFLPPLPVGSLGTAFPKPQRCYLGFGDPIDLSECKGKKLTKKRLYAIREQVAGQIEQQLKELLFTREKNKGSDSLLRRLLTL
jgi:1-acyl-sn-glycerol-3-phosphate acyltransferase